MTSHLGLMVVFALFVSTVFATLMRDERVSSLVIELGDGKVVADSERGATLA